MHFRVNQTFLAFLLISIISTLVYLNALDNPFQYDDQPSIEENVYLRMSEGIRDIFISPGYYVRITEPGAGHYRPVLFITLLLNYRLGGLDVVGYHLVNLAFHVGSAFLVFLIVQAMSGGSKEGVAAGFSLRPRLIAGDKGLGRRLKPAATSYLPPPTYTALTAALIFAVHPFNSEVVNYITARSSVMSAFFYLLAFYCWVKFRTPPPFPPPQGGRVREGVYFYIASLLAFLLGMLTKEVVITLPVVLWLYDMYFYRPFRRTQAEACGYYPYLPFLLLVAIPYVMLRMFFTGAMFPTFKRDLLTQFFTEIPVLAKYVRLSFIPIGLNVDHYVPIYRRPDLPVITSALFLILFMVMAIGLWKSKKIEWRVVSFFVVWFFIVLLPTTVIPLNAIMQENRGYLSAAALAIIMGAVLGQVAAGFTVKIHPHPDPPPSEGEDEGVSRDRPSGLSNKQAAYSRCAILGLILISLSLATLHRNSLWGDKITLWSDAVSKSPLSARGHVNLGVSYAAEGMYRKGEKELLTALRSDDPPQFDIHLNLGSIYHKTGRMDTALKEYQKAAIIQPQDFRPRYGLGALYQQKGDAELAIREYQKVIELNPNDFRTYHNLGLLYQNSGDYETAIRYHKKALSLNPAYVKSAFNLGKIYEEAGKIDMAINEYYNVIGNDPGYTDAYQRLGDLYKKKGDMQRAEKFYREAQKIRNER